MNGERNDIIVEVDVGIDVSVFCVSLLPIILSIEKSAFDDGGLVLDTRGDVESPLSRVGSVMGGSRVLLFSSCVLGEWCCGIMGDRYGYGSPVDKIDECAVCGENNPCGG